MKACGPSLLTFARNSSFSSKSSGSIITGTSHAAKSRVQELLKQAGAVHVLNENAADFREALRRILKAEPARIFLDAVTGPVGSAVFAVMPKRARWIVYGRLDPSPTVIEEPAQLIFAGKRIEGFWLAEWMRKSPPERRAHAAIEAQKRFSDGRWSTDVTAVLPLDEAMAKVPAELAKPNGKVFIRP